ncbi:hypothetical protein G8764_16785 [Pseudomaricurvus alcaniphilus]|uniref:hypothetical protein n=1 Tax=Pseudomaricurvus alcaniphilus TaxID=1166482 RepID=UPI001409FD2A|nr:hypothetical protein [Pseudomaricurvus alcaniphilus]NHN38967.1 hypothetical protein [Pseudomaricurvus alcaniphilus]
MSNPFDPSNTNTTPTPTTTVQSAEGSSDSENTSPLDAPVDLSLSPGVDTSGASTEKLIPFSLTPQSTSPSSLTKSPPKAVGEESEKELPPDEIDEMSPTSGVEASGSSNTGGAFLTLESLPAPLTTDYEICRDLNGVGHIVNKTISEAFIIGSKRANSELRRIAKSKQLKVSPKDMRDINEELFELAEEAPRRQIFNRVGPITNGVELYLGDEKGSRVRVTAAGVEVIQDTSINVFYVPPTSGSLPIPETIGDLAKLKPYVNVSHEDYILFLAWMSFTLAHPKLSATNYLHLDIRGCQGSGKTSLCKNIVLPLLDPTSIGIQSFPRKNEDLAILASTLHVVCFDNMRNFKSDTSDLLCILSSGGAFSTRALYTNSELSVKHAHCAIVFNGIHTAILQPDLAQRCLPIHTLAIDEKSRQSEAFMMQRLHQELPAIYKGLLDLTSKILFHLPGAAVTHPERMVDFCQWLAAFESVKEVPAGTFQQLYSDALRQASFDKLMEHQLSAVMVEFAIQITGGEWSGTPKALLQKLDEMSDTENRYSREWPQNPIALTKRLKGLAASLLTQGISLEFARGKYRTITVKYTGTAIDDSPEF